jgi:hypothetical protein
MDRFAVVTARMPQYVQQERFDAGSMEVHLFDTKDDATEWAILNPNYITEVVPVTTHEQEPDPDRFGSDDEVDVTVRPTSSCSCGYEVVWVNGAWEHDAAPSFWGDDHDANADAPDVEDPARKYWDIEDGVRDDGE